MIDYFKKISEYYKPSVPIDNPDMFIGRLEEKSLLLRTLVTPGRHALIYGLRGIGKTSLINITSKVFSINSDIPYKIVSHTCSYNDTYESILFSILNSSQLNLEENEKIKLTGKGKAGFNVPFLVNAGTEGGIEKEILKGKIIETKISPNFFCDLISNKNLLLILDEFDRIKDVETITLFSETLKILSDKNSTSKFIMAGVANASNDLFGGHLSINRSLINIELPLMTEGELLEIINFGSSRLNITFDDEIIKIIIWLSDGMPFFTHLLAEELAANALYKNEKIITTAHLRSIIKNILKSRTYEIINYEYESILSEKQRPFFELNPYQTKHSMNIKNRG
ncbi:MAG: ATP-binding protein [Chitinophagaceae bacterium]|nr:ATP-binding protein [Chitinophagaceae bacterium]